MKSRELLKLDGGELPSKEELKRKIAHYTMMAVLLQEVYDEEYNDEHIS